jgi:hypothetical protein
MSKSNDQDEKPAAREPHFHIWRIPLIFGILVRAAVWFYYPQLSSLLDDRVEITTPITSFKRRKIG